MATSVRLRVNGQDRSLELDPRVTLLARIQGIGEVANAVAHATGVRVRRPPIALDHLLPALP